MNFLLRGVKNNVRARERGGIRHSAHWSLGRDHRGLIRKQGAFFHYAVEVFARSHFVAVAVRGGSFMS